MRRRGVICDGDDTLWATMPLYTAAKERFFRLMGDEGFDVATAEQVFEAIDLANVDRFGFTKVRFPTSMCEAYTMLCTKAGRIARHDIADEAAHIGEAVFTQQSPLIDHADAVLADLRRDYFVILVTKGDPDVQLRRLKEASLSPLFHAVYTFANKSSVELEQVVRECKLVPSLSWAVGNSVPSDIMPAVAIGLRAVWVPFETWAYEAGVPTTTPGVFRCSTLEDVPRLIRQIDQKGTKPAK